MAYIGIRPAGISSASQVETDQLTVDNVKIDGNTISSTDTNGDITLDPDGTGVVVANSKIQFGSDAQTNITGGGASDVDLILSGDTNIRFETSTNEQMRIDAGGSMLLGSTTPTDLHNTWRHIIVGDKGAIISQDGAGGVPGMTIADNAYVDADTGGFAYQTTDQASKLTQEAGVLTFSNAASGTAGASLSLTERMRITSGGELLVGGTSGDSYGGVPATNTMYGLAGSGAYALGLTQNTTSGGGGRVLGLRNVTDFNNTGNEIINYVGNTTQRFVVVSNGNVYNTNNTYGAISDQKLKEQITDAPSQWDDIKALAVRKYKMKDEVLAEGDSNAAWKLGVVAQELETAGMAGLVDERIDRDEDGNDAGTTTKSVKYSVLYMKAIKALQEAMDRIEALETENNTQATQIADLITRVTALENA